MRRFLILICALLLSFSYPLNAQSSTDSIEETLVYASLIPISLEQSANAITVINYSQIKNRSHLLNKYNDYSKKFENKEVPRPNYWVGIKIVPIEYEFWEGGEFRMHKREVYSLTNKTWKKKILSP